MTLQEFQKTVTKSNWYDKYYYYLISLAVIGLSIFLFYDLTTHPAKYKVNHAIFYSLFSLLFLFGCYAFYLVPNRYKILSVDNNLSIDKKKKIIAEVLAKFDIPYNDNKDTFCYFKYQSKWWTSDYDVYLNVDNKKFYVSVLGRTHYKGGFIDFGGAERLRRKIVSAINSLTSDK